MNLFLNLAGFKISTSAPKLINHCSNCNVSGTLALISNLFPAVLQQFGCCLMEFPKDETPLFYQRQLQTYKAHRYKQNQDYFMNEFIKVKILGSLTFVSKISTSSNLCKGKYRASSGSSSIIQIR